MSKVAIYARVSTIDKQDYTRQVNDCKSNIGDRYDDSDIEIYAEQISGYSDNEKRPQLNKLLNIIEQDNKYFDSIYITEISRLGRDPRLTRKLIDDLTDKKIPIYITSINRSTLDENGERDSIMNIVIQVLMEFADSESKTMKKRSKSGLLQSVKNGNVGGSRNIPYGFKKGDDKKLIICEEESLIIKEIYNYYLNGSGFKMIAGFLNLNKVPTRVNKAFGNQLMNFKTVKTADKVIWTDKAVNEILNNSIYKGDRKYKGGIYKVESIITNDVYNECQNIRNDKTHQNYLTTYIYLLKDLLICGCCGRNYFAKYKPTVGGDKVYICSSRTLTNNNCGNVGINISYIDSVIYDILIDTDIFLEYIDDKDSKIAKIKYDIDIMLLELNVLKNKLIDITNKNNRLLNAFVDGIVEQAIYLLKKDEQDILYKKIEQKINIVQINIDDRNNHLITLNNIDIISKGKIEYKSRTQIKKIYQQLISKIIITNVDGRFVICDLFLKVDYPTIKILLDLSVTRKKVIEYKYKMGGVGMDKIIYDNNIMLSNKMEILNNFDTNRLTKNYFVVQEKNIITL